MDHILKREEKKSKRRKYNQIYSSLGQRERDEFDMFWNSYPRRKGKEDAVKAWSKVIERGIPATVVSSGAAAYRAECERTSKEKQYIKMPATWLNGGCWDDESDDDVTKQSQDKDWSKERFFN